MSAAVLSSASLASILALVPPVGQARRRDIVAALAGQLAEVTVSAGLQQLVDAHELKRVGFGVYARPDAHRTERAQERMRHRNRRAGEHAPHARGFVTLSRTRGLTAVALGRAEYPEAVPPLPATRGDCKDGPRPCPRASCRHHLALDVARNGNLVLAWRDREIDELPATCSLDVADQGGETLEATAAAMNLTRERARQIEVRALAKIKAGAPWLVEQLDQAGRGLRRLPVLQDDFEPDEEVPDAAE